MRGDSRLTSTITLSPSTAVTTSSGMTKSPAFSMSTTSSGRPPGATSRTAPNSSVRSCGNTWYPTSINGSLRAMPASFGTWRSVRPARQPARCPCALARDAGDAYLTRATIRRIQMAQLRVACLLGPDFEDSEFRVPYDRLRKEGYQVDIIGTKAGQEVKGKKGKETVKI